MIKITTSNLFETNADIIVNTVNCIGVMGKGIALQCKKLFPNNYRAYLEHCKNKQLKPGDILLNQDGGKKILNLATKDHWKNESKYEWIDTGIKNIQNVLSQDKTSTISIPMIGCGNGGLKWDIVKEKIISQLTPYASNRDIFIHETPNTKTYKWKSCECCIKKGEFDIDNIPLDCSATWDLISSGRTIGVFQLETKLGQDWAKKVQPQSVQELSDLIALLRPSCLESNMAQDYVDRKNGTKSVEYIHDSLKPILKDTFGTLVYQEQSLKIAKDIAGFTLAQADSLRKGIGKKLPEIISKCKKEFMEGCIKTKIVDEKIAEQIFGWIEKAQRYQFNKCVSGNTIIKRTQKNKYNTYLTVKDMYRIRNDIEYAKKNGHLSLYKRWKLLKSYDYGLSMSDNGRIYKNKIIDIRYVGVKPIYRISLDNGMFIDATENHKFPTIDGIKTTNDLSIKDRLYVLDSYDKNNLKNRKYSLTNKKQNNLHNSYGSRHGFPYGKDNPGYIDGSHSKYKSFKSKNNKICAYCDSIRNIEIHHIDGNRNNNEEENLINLCSSCHKKVEYKNGRTKKGEKGFLTSTVKILSIKYLGSDDVYDVEMNAPNHNFVANDGIVTCNSHSISYAMLGYQTAYLKCHFPAEFYISYLNYARYKTDPKEEIYNLVQDAKFFGIEILPPNIKNGNLDFCCDGDNKNRLFFGLSHILGIGDSVINKLKSMDNFIEFVKYVPVLHRNVSEALIKSGACDSFKIPRIKMIKAIEILYGTTGRDNSGKSIQIKGLTKKELSIFMANIDQTNSIIKSLEFLCDKDTKGVLARRKDAIKIKLDELKNTTYNDTYTAKATAEKHYLGIALSCSPADDVSDEESSYTCLDFAKAVDGVRGSMCCVVDSVRHTKTKKGKNPGQPMCIMKISDSTYCIDSAIVFPDVYIEYKDICREDLIVRVSGYKKNGILVVEEIVRLI